MPHPPRFSWPPERRRETGPRGPYSGRDLINFVKDYDYRIVTTPDGEEDETEVPGFGHPGFDENADRPIFINPNHRAVYASMGNPVFRDFAREWYRVPIVTETEIAELREALWESKQRRRRERET